MSPIELWELAAAGDRGAFAEIYEQHADRVLRHLRARVEALADAEDMTAAVFEAAWRYRASIVPHSTAGILPWLLTTASNQARRYHRSRARRRRLLSMLPVVGSQPDIAEEVVQDQEDKWRVKLLRQTLNRLCNTDRLVLEYRLIENLPAAEIALLLGMPASTVRTRLARALPKARSIYLELAGDGYTRVQHRGKNA